MGSPTEVSIFTRDDKRDFRKNNMSFKKIDSKLNLPLEEEKVLESWKVNNTFNKSLEKESPKGNFVFFEGPPTANGQPGIHHVEARSFKDLFCRYKTMQGYHVERKAGWDTHGLPVELQVEKQLGISGKPQIENIVEGDKRASIEKFNELCKQSVWRYKEEWEKLTERMAYWVDMEDPYVTYDPKYIESVWNIIAEINNKGLLYKGHKVVPYCPRCGTTLSSHEVAQGYKKIKEESVYIKLKATASHSDRTEESSEKSERAAFGLDPSPTVQDDNVVAQDDSGMARNDGGDMPTYFLAWTTTPWTLAGNAALAFNSNIIYCKVQLNNPVMLNSFQHDIAGEEILKQVQDDKIEVQNDNFYILAKNRVEFVLQGQDYEIVEELTGQEILDKYSIDGQDYEPIYPDGEQFSEAGDKAYKLILADYVSDADGTGIVHIAPAFGEDDYVCGFQQNGIKVLKTVDEKGIELAGAGDGKFVKKADSYIKEDLENRGLLFKKEMIEHDYPFCWRCDTPLLYMARDSWYIAMSKLRQQLLRNNEQINWNPGYLKHGRFGNWLENVNDWAISRDRYWGTPLPVWECENCKKYKVISSLSEVGGVEPHKPFIDEIEFDCECGGKMKRASEVMDVWLDSGTMPFSQYHYPFENKELIDDGAQYPAEFICEAVDQTRGWFYTLLAISTIIKDQTPYKNVISVGHVLDEKGKKMSKSLGNIVQPNDAFQKYGADAVRFYFYSVNQPGEPKLFADKEVISISRNLFLTLWNVVGFFNTYASIDNFIPQGNLTSENVLDKWILSKYQQLVNTVTKALDGYDPYKASNSIIDFVGELSTWYVRRSRRRFWKSENDTDKLAAYETLYSVLVGLSKLLAPMTPMFAETLFSNLKLANDEESVHLTTFPTVNNFDSQIVIDMENAKKVVEAGLSARATAGIKIRQPLSSVTYYGLKLDDQLENIIAEEINVKEIKHSTEKSDKKAELDLNISEELKSEGLARDLIRNIQALRKKSGFDVENRIKLSYSTDSGLLRSTMASFGDMIAKEVLADKIEEVSKDDAEGSEDFSLDGEKIWIGLNRK